MECTEVGSLNSYRVFAGKICTHGIYEYCEEGHVLATTLYRLRDKAC
jgi:hypothetical protein